MRKIDKEKKEKKMLFIPATNVVASRPPERPLTGMPHARTISPLTELGGQTEMIPLCGSILQPRAENLSTLSLQDRATEWLYDLTRTIHP